VLAEPKTGQAYRHMERGQNLERQGRLDEAMLEFKHAIEADPSIPSAHVALGQHYRRKGLLTKAADELHTAALLSADYASYFELGRILSELERYQDAQEAFQQCLSIDPDEPSARYELASVLYAQGDFTQALQQLQALAPDFPTDLELQTAIAECYLALRDYGAAESILARALDEAPPEDDREDLYEAWLVARRHLEFDPQPDLSVKDMLYAEQGILCLGTRHDNGLDIPVYENHTFTYGDIAATCRRLVALQGGLRWPLRAVAAVDSSALPLTIALSQLLQLPTEPLEAAGKGGLTLVILAAVARPEIWQVTRERMSGPVRSFGLALTWQPDQGPVPDVVGLLCRGRCLMPWQRSPKPSPEAAAASILRAYAAQSGDDNVAAQIAYYKRHHSLLRFAGDVMIGAENRTV